MRTITFDYNGHRLTARAYCNFNGITDLIVVIPQENKYFKETILLFKEGGKWVADLLLVKNYPATVRSLIRTLQNSLGI